MNRLTQSLSTALLLALLALAAGCDKRPTGLDPNPNMPEGVTSPVARLITYRNNGLRVMVRDYASTNIDSTVTEATAFAGSSTMPLLLLVDSTVANTFDFYRTASSGAYEPLHDFPVQSQFKYVDAGTETFFTTDPAPGGYSPQTYLARGRVNGLVSHASPLSNLSRLVAPTLPLSPYTGLPSITYNGDRQPFDSLFTVSWVGVPGAVGYWVHIYEKPISAGERIVSSLPGPIAYKTAGDLLIGYWNDNIVGGTNSFALGTSDSRLLTLKRTIPLLGRDYHVRLTAVDATYHVIAQTPGNLDSLALSADLNYLNIANYDPEKSKVFFSLGGVRVTRRKPLVGPATGPQAVSPVQGRIERHVAPVAMPVVGPARRSR